MQLLEVHLFSEECGLNLHKIHFVIFWGHKVRNGGMSLLISWLRKVLAVVWQNYYFFEKQYTYFNKTKVGLKLERRYTHLF